MDKATRERIRARTAKNKAAAAEKKPIVIADVENYSTPLQVETDKKRSGPTQAQIDKIISRKKARQEAEYARLPDKANFNVNYDALTEAWSGTLMVDGRTFSGSASGVFNLLRLLDKMFRKHLAEQQELVVI